MDEVLVKKEESCKMVVKEEESCKDEDVKPPAKKAKVSSHLSAQLLPLSTMVSSFQQTSLSCSLKPFLSRRIVVLRL